MFLYVSFLHITHTLIIWSEILLIGPVSRILGLSEKAMKAMKGHCFFLSSLHSMCSMPVHLPAVRQKICVSYFQSANLQTEQRMFFRVTEKLCAFLSLKSCWHDCIQQPHCVRYIVVFVPSVDWPIMPDCVPWGKRSPRVVSEWPNYALAFNVTVGSPGPIQKSFFGRCKATSNL